MIRWIVDGTLGTAAYSDDLRAIATIVDVRELADRPGNDPHALRLKVEEGIAALNRGDRVIVTCDFGISRSNAIAAGILAKWQKQSLDWAVDETVARTQEPSIKLDVISAIRRAMFEGPASTDPGCVLVTGATGFLGYNLLAALSNKLEVFAPGRSEIDLLGAATQLERFCRDRRVGQILHLAHPRFFTTNEAMGQSLTMLKNLIDVCRVLEIRLILPSSRAVFSGYRSDGRWVGPDAVLRPKGVYGETKYLQEILVSTAVSNEEIDAAVREASEGKLKNILGINHEPLVSIDFNNDPRSSVYDATQTRVMGGTLVKVLAWYDNEWGFSNRMLDIALAFANAR